MGKWRQSRLVITNSLKMIFPKFLTIASFFFLHQIDIFQIKEL